MATTAGKLSLVVITAERYFKIVFTSLHTLFVFPFFCWNFTIGAALAWLPVFLKFSVIPCLTEFFNEYHYD